MRLVGLMSGTSLDGIDAALVEFNGIPGIDLGWKLLAFVTTPYSDELRAAILDACRPDAPLQSVVALNARLGEELAYAAEHVGEEAGYQGCEADAIASHGQTVWHQPEPFDVAGLDVTGTLQIGEPAVIAARIGRPVVSDFRAADMALGGQGAPLVPFLDWALYGASGVATAVQNLGGIGNVTYLPADSNFGNLIAFDTGPANMVIDAFARFATDGKCTFDAGGDMAAKGRVDSTLLDQCLAHPYFAASPPKSTGREMFGDAYAAMLWEAARARGLTPQDALATATALTAESVARAYRDFLAPRGTPERVILGGGGIHNHTLRRMLQERLAPIEIVTNADFGLLDDAKEAVAFALLGYETLNGRPSNVPAATGARSRAILGKITPPPDTLSTSFRHPDY